ncbi:MAG: hypothetical protein ACI8QZ_000880 [Chlamydiales bacterium]|jgi:hypothetical protein
MHLAETLKPPLRRHHMLSMPIGVIALALPAAAGDLELSLSPSEVAEVTETSATSATFLDALKGGESWLKLNYRFEEVDQTGFAKNAHASTLRTALGYRTGKFGSFQAMLEFEDVSVLGDAAYDSTTNMMTSRPVVADPEGAEVNQVYLSYFLDDANEARLGRQEIKIDNDRFIGNVGWRQNRQSFDAASWSATQVGGAVDVYYAFISNVNRVFGDASAVGDQRMESHVLNVSHDVEGWGRASVYTYLLDYDTLDAMSTSTIGARFDGKHAFAGFDLLYLAELANQTDAGDNATDLDAGYLHATLGAKVNAHTFKIGMEVLDGSGAPGDKFTTPLATAHAFNGWADKFLTTPDTGLADTYLSAGTQVGDVQLLALYHDFSADSGGMDYGTEFDLLATYPVNEDMTVGLKFADYDADMFATDTTKAWAWIALSF